FKFKRFESDHERGDYIAGVGRKNRHGYHFVDPFTAGLSISLDVPDFLRVWQSVQGELRFCFSVQLSNIVGIQRLDDCPCAVEEAVKSRVKRLRRLLRRRFLPGTHGKSTWNVSPFFNSTGFSRVVLLSIHALRV